MDVLRRYFSAFVAEPAWLAVASAVFGLALLPMLWPHVASRLPARLAFWTLLAALCAGAVAWALHLGWLADDAFISFRYSRNWANGEGLVYNAGERVEGYTNFLWVAVLTPF